jgi:hypothetical protein
VVGSISGQTKEESVSEDQERRRGAIPKDDSADVEGHRLAGRAAESDAETERHETDDEPDVEAHSLELGRNVERHAERHAERHVERHTES